jgi:glycosyltransferase involved in cell wall biosynthesis
MQSADVTVIVPVYNRAATVLETLSTVVEQTLVPRRIIIVDDGSEDETYNSIERWIAEHRPASEILLIRQSHQGAGAARNRGLEAVGDCRFVAFLDSDDQWPADFLSRAVLQLDQEVGAVAATGDRVYHRAWKRRLGFHSTRGLKREATSWLLANNCGIGSCTLFRSDVVRQLGGFNVSIPTGQDAELFLRISTQGQWAHIKGEPVRFYMGYSTKRGEQANLSLEYADRARRRIRIRERFIFEQGGRQFVPRATYERILAKFWHKAASTYRLQHQEARCIACYERALYYRPKRIGTWVRLSQMVALQSVKAALNGIRRTGLLATLIYNHKLPLASDSAAV